MASISNFLSANPTGAPGGGGGGGDEAQGVVELNRRTDISSLRFWTGTLVEYRAIETSRVVITGFDASLNGTYQEIFPSNSNAADNDDFPDIPDFVGFDPTITNLNTPATRVAGSRVFQNVVLATATDPEMFTEGDARRYIWNRSDTMATRGGWHISSPNATEGTWAFASGSRTPQDEALADVGQWRGTTGAANPTTPMSPPINGTSVRIGPRYEDDVLYSVTDDRNNQSNILRDGGLILNNTTGVGNTIYTLGRIMDTSMTRTLTLPRGTEGAVVEIVNQSTFDPANPGTRLTSGMWIVAPAPGERINSLPMDEVLNLNNTFASFTLIYRNATLGWGITAVN